MNEVEHVLKPTTAGDILNAHVGLLKKVVNPKTYINTYQGYKEGKGFMYSPEYKYLGPGNPLDGPITPYNYEDAHAFLHDKAYEDYQKRTGKKPYFTYIPADDKLIESVKWDSPQALTVQYVFRGKKGLSKLGILGSDMSSRK